VDDRAESDLAWELADVISPLDPEFGVLRIAP
jgi:hypothetical protein